MNEMTELISKLIEWIETASPQLWAILIKQVYVDAFGKLAWAVSLIALAILSVRIFRICQRKHKEDEYEMYDVLAGFDVAVGIMAAGVGFGLLISAIQWFINPEFYAIRYILGIVSG